MAEEIIRSDQSGEVTMRIWRGDETGGEFTEYVMPAQEGEVVLDVIHRVQATEAPDLACRWNCKAGKCGSCSAEINGRPSLMCMTRMDTLPPGETVTVAPMRTFPVIRDLVTDVSYNYEVAKRIPPLSARPKTADEEKAGGYRMAQIDVERSQEFRKCIECFLCQDVCHVVRDHEENKTAYAGPRFFIRSAELEMHPLDTNDRRQLLQEEQGLGKCNITKCCTEVCPEHIKITDNAIIPLKERVVDAKYDPVAWLGRKIRNRTKRTAAEAAAEAPAAGPAAVLPPAGVHGVPQPHPVGGADPGHRAGRQRVPDRDAAAAAAAAPADAVTDPPVRTMPDRRATPRADDAASTSPGVTAGVPGLPRFLTADWAAAFNAALDGVRCPAPGRTPGLAAADGAFTVAEEVRGGPDGDVRLVLRAADGAARPRDRSAGRARTGTDAGRHVTVALDYDDAVATGHRRAVAGRGAQRREDPGARATCRCWPPARSCWRPPGRTPGPSTPTPPTEVRPVVTAPRQRAVEPERRRAVDILSSRTLLHPADLDRTLAFYRDILGLAVAREFGEGDHRGVVFFAGGGLLEVVGSGPPPGSSGCRALAAGPVRGRPWPS